MKKKKNQPADRSVVVVILGMHRSGTSVVTRMVNLMGAELGDNLMRPAKDNNDFGFWEHQLVVDLNDKIFEIFGMSWDSIDALPSGWQSDISLKPLHKEAIKIISDEFAGQKLWAFKDPRLCRLMPFWKPVLENFGAEIRYLLCLRNPSEVCSSLQKRDNIPLNVSYDLWLRYSLEMEENTRGEKRTFISYDQVMQNWRQVAENISNSFNIPEFSHLSDAKIHELDNLIRPDMRHHVVDQNNTFFIENTPNYINDFYLEISRYIQEPENQKTEHQIIAISKSYKKGYAYFQTLLKGLSDRIDLLKKDLHKSNLQISEREGVINERDSRLAERDDRIRERDARIQDRDARLAERDDRIRERDARIQDRDARLAERDDRIRERDARIHEQNDLIQQRDIFILKMDDDIKEFIQKIENADLRLHELSLYKSSLEHDIQQIKDSTSWKITAPMRWIRNLFALSNWRHVSPGQPPLSGPI